MLLRYRPTAVRQLPGFDLLIARPLLFQMALHQRHPSTGDIPDRRIPFAQSLHQTCRWSPPTSYASERNVGGEPPLLSRQSELPRSILEQPLQLEKPLSGRPIGPRNPDRQHPRTACRGEGIGFTCPEVDRSRKRKRFGEADCTLDLLRAELSEEPERQVEVRPQRPANRAIDVESLEPLDPLPNPLRNFMRKEKCIEESP